VSTDAPEVAREEPGATGVLGGLRAVLGGTVGMTLWLVLIAVLVAASVVFGLRVRAAEQREQDRDAALQAARQQALNLTSVDGTDLERDLDLVLAGASGQFRTEFAAQAERLTQVLTENEVRAEGRVLDAGLVRADEDSATAVVVVDSLVRNKSVPDGQNRNYRMQLELDHVGDRWLTSSLQFVG
jgi:Mce-associated membrane protein